MKRQNVDKCIKNVDLKYSNTTTKDIQEKCKKSKHMQITHCNISGFLFHRSITFNFHYHCSADIYEKSKKKLTYIYAA